MIEVLPLRLLHPIKHVPARPDRLIVQPPYTI
jgi:hypothetical protein